MLPNMKYNGGASRSQNIVFKGLNLSDTATEGELIACTNLSARRFPHLSARSGRTRKGKYDKATAAFMWNGHEIVTEGGKLLYDGVALCNCNAEPKQFAVVNTKLVVWPDKLVIDMTDKTFRKLDALITNNGEAVCSDDSISFVPRSIYASLLHEAWGSNKEGLYLPWMWTYESVEWDDEKGWTRTDPQLEPMNECNGRYYIPNIRYNESTGERIVDLPITMFPSTFGGEVTAEELPEPEGNNEGFYCELVSQRMNYHGGNQISCEQNINAYWSAQDNDCDLKSLFEPGDEVKITNSRYGLIDCTGITVASVDEETVTFEKGELPPVKFIYEFAEDWDGDGADIEMSFSVGGDILSLLVDTRGIKTGNIIVLEYRDDTEKWEEYKVHFIDPVTGEEFGTLSTDFGPWGGDGSMPERPMQAYDPGRLTVQRVAYDFDYICEKDNRLWGVCNRQKDSSDGARGRLIFASALGDPTEFDKFEGLSTDSWQAAIAGDGDFTACCNYGDCVLFFKEDKVYKVAGDLPEQYTLYPYYIAGVQQGSHKSLVNINETLLYKGVNGVYAYGGGVPSLMSSALGRKKYYDACAGSDGIVYYISMRDEEGYHLFTYDTLTGVWLREDDTAASDFCFSGGDLLMLAGGKLFLINGEAATDDGTPIKWSAELAPFSEATDHNRRSYSRLLLRSNDTERKDSINVHMAQNNGRWIPCKKVMQSVGDYIVPLVPNRKNDLKIKIEGKSPDAVISIAREYIGGSELGGVK